MFPFSGLFSRNKENKLKSGNNSQLNLNDPLTWVDDEDPHTANKSLPNRHDAKQGPLSLLMRKTDNKETDGSSDESKPQPQSAVGPPKKPPPPEPVPLVEKPGTRRSSITSKGSGGSKRSKAVNSSRYSAAENLAKANKKAPEVKAPPPPETFFSDTRRRSVGLELEDDDGAGLERKSSKVKFEAKESREEVFEIPSRADDDYQKGYEKFKGCRSCCFMGADYRDDRSILCTKKFKDKYKSKGKTIKFTETTIKDQAELIKQPPEKSKIKEKYVPRSQQMTLSKSLQDIFRPTNDTEPTAPFGCTASTDRSKNEIYQKCESFLCNRKKTAGCADCNVVKNFYDREDDLPHKLTPNYDPPKKSWAPKANVEVAPLYLICRSGMCSGNMTKAQPLATELQKVKESFPRGYLITKSHSAEDAGTKYCSCASREDKNKPIIIPERKEKPACEKCKCSNKGPGDLDYDKDYGKDCKCACHKRKTECVIMKRKDPVGT